MNFVFTVDLKVFPTRQFLNTIFGFINIKLLYTQNTTIQNSINIVTNSQMYIFHMLCELTAV